MSQYETYVYDYFLGFRVLPRKSSYVYFFRDFLTLLTFAIMVAKSQMSLMIRNKNKPFILLHLHAIISQVFSISYLFEC